MFILEVLKIGYFYISFQVSTARLECDPVFAELGTDYSNSNLTL